MRVLVTGGDGFIGRHLRNALVGHQVVSFQGDVTKEEDWDRVHGEFDAIVHLAALISPAESMEIPDDYRLNNVYGTQLLLAKMAGRFGRILLASSCSVYGECPGLDEFSDLYPQSVYAETKVRQEELVSSQDSVILRLFSVYGPGQSNPVGGLVGMLARPVLDGKRATVYEDGQQTRDLIYVTDVCNAFVAALTGPLGVYNVGTGTAVTVLDLAREITERLGGRLKPRPNGSMRPGDIRHAVANTERIWHDYGWQAQVPLDAGLDRYCEGLK